MQKRLYVVLHNKLSRTPVQEMVWVQGGVYNGTMLGVNRFPNNQCKDDSALFSRFLHDKIPIHNGDSDVPGRAHLYMYVCMYVCMYVRILCL